MREEIRQQPKKDDLIGPCNDSYDIPVQSNDIVLNKVFSHFDFVEDEASVGFRSGPQKRSGYVLALWMWLSVSIDWLIVTSASLSFVFVGAQIISHSFRSELGFLFSHDNFILTVAIAAIFTGWMYFISTRAIFGYSLGEKACSLRLGQPHERLNQRYTFKIIIRSTVNLLTGIILLPLLSIIFQRDLLGKVSGIYIYTLK
ncbi:MAG: hypothetical protein ACK41T_05545 [Pseudobdellovibrio sp.]